MLRLVPPWLGFLLLAPSVAAAAPKVVVSIQPLHSLVAGVMDGVAVPDLLIRGNVSEHSYTLRPSDARLLEAAELVFWVGEDLEAYLRKPLRSLARRAQVIPLATKSGVALLPTREAGAWEIHEHSHHGGRGAKAHDHGHRQGAHDMHFWLDPENAKRSVSAVAAVLSATDRANAQRYAENGSALLDRLSALDAELRGTLAPVQNRPFIVFHDAYQYLEARYGLKAVGSVTLDPERQPGPRRLYEVRAKILESGARCVFAEPQYDSGLVQTIVSGTPAKAAELDPLGASLAPGPDAYFIMLRQLAASMLGCLRG